jgi:hypothetical protein
VQGFRRVRAAMAKPAEFRPNSVYSAHCSQYTTK